MRRLALSLSCLYMFLAYQSAWSDEPQESDDAYAANRDLAAMYRRSAEAADVNETLTIKVAMARLLWPVDVGVLKPPGDDPKFREQIKALQVQMGASPTGILTVSQEAMLMRAAGVLLERRISGGMKKVARKSNDGKFVGVWGSWSMEDTAFPINTTRIECWLPDGTCIVSTANLDFHDVRGAKGTQLLDVTSDQYEIKSSSDETVTAESQHPCGKATLMIDIKTESAKIVGVPYRAPGSCRKPGASIETPEREKIQVATLVDPWDASEKFFKARRAAAEKLVYKANIKVFEIWK